MMFPLVFSSSTSNLAETEIRNDPAKPRKRSVHEGYKKHIENLRNEEDRIQDYVQNYVQEYICLILYRGCHIL
jgi:hypothetical protein